MSDLTPVHPILFFATGMCPGNGSIALRSTHLQTNFLFLFVHARSQQYMEFTHDVIMGSVFLLNWLDLGP